jgi:imidazoleglycerol-phosphate dehydratase
MNDASTIPAAPANTQAPPPPKSFPLPVVLADGSLYVRMDGGEEDTTVGPPEHRYEEELRLTPESAAGRSYAVRRQTAETKIEVSMNLDGSGKSTINTGVGFFDHMLTLLSRHSLIDLTVQASGDLHVDAHHTVEDVGICFGKALRHSLGSKAGVRRYGAATLPMDETLATAAVDLCGRPFCVWKADVPLETLGTFSSTLAEEFWRAVSSSGAFALHVVLHHGRNTHHIIEAIFKATARALREAVELDPRSPGVPSTKGVL